MTLSNSVVSDSPKDVPEIFQIMNEYCEKDFNDMISCAYQGFSKAFKVFLDYPSNLAILAHP